MAVTATSLAKLEVSEGGRRVYMYAITFDASYGAGGEAITANELGLQRIDAVIPAGALVTATTAYTVVPVIAAAGASVSLRLFGMAAAAGVGTALTETNVANQSATTVAIIVIGV